MARIPAYKAIQRDIMDRISDGRLRPGDRISTEAELMQQYGVSRITAQRALSELKQAGVLMRKPRAGSFVAPSRSSCLEGAEAMAEHRSIGVVAPFVLEQSDTYHYLDGIMQAISRSRDNVMLRSTLGTIPKDREMLEACLSDGCEGVLYYPGGEDAPPVDLLARMSAWGIPCVLLDKPVAGVDMPCVRTDNVHAAYVVTAHVLSKGHRNLVYLADGRTIPAYERYRGFCRALEEKGLGSLWGNHFLILEKKDALEDEIAGWRAQGVTAVCCANDWVARAVVDACGQMGVDVPGELAVAGFDGMYRGEITSMLQPYAKIGRTAAQRLLSWIASGEDTREDVFLEAVLVEGKTV